MSEADCRSGAAAPYKPDFDRDLKPWVIVVAKDHYWRVAGYMDFEDLVQEGAYMFAYLLVHCRPFQNRKHLMSIFKVEYLRRIHDLSRKTTKHRSVVAPLTDPTRNLPEPVAFADGPLVTFLNELPHAYIRQLEALANGSIVRILDKLPHRVVRHLQECLSRGELPDPAIFSARKMRPEV